VSRHFLWLRLPLDDGPARKEETSSALCLTWSSSLGGVGLLLESCLAWGVVCSKGAFVGMEGDSLLDFYHTPITFGGLVCEEKVSEGVCVCRDTRRLLTPKGTFRYVPQAA
jgi:hypothetical protein